MARILAATYDIESKAQAAVRALLAQGIAEDSISSFHNNPPGQHGTFPIGGDEHADPGARGVGRRTAGGAAIGAGVGASVGAVVGGPLGAVAGGGVGAFAGAMAGTYTGLAQDADLHQGVMERRPAGTIVAVRRQEPEREDGPVLRALRDAQPLALEEAEGELREGKWLDFDPTARPRVLGHRSRSASNAA
jgi:hypothetical protein